ncbi:PAS domain S-box protein [Halorarum halophilum]|uniref:histidine kinase n=1 Tax=Halorarum halophilum TaxID=2743090 RepID=A0A7D5GJ64_9EURY|nr:PAS domain S-box protein [Halobaculum halophilum]QLG28651.1 PAS domain S-box protein [Halobaculum halophilum]
MSRVRDGARPDDADAVLHVDAGERAPDPATAALSARPGVAIESLRSANAAVDRLAAGDVDCLVCDPDDLGGTAFLCRVRGRHPGLPVVVYTRDTADAVLDWVAENGPAAYLRKGDGRGEERSEALWNRVERVLPGASLERDEALVETIHDPVYVLGATGEFTFVNDAFCAATGYDRETLVGRDGGVVERTELDGDDGRAFQRRLFERGARAGQVEVMLGTADGGTLYCEDHVSLLPAPDAEFAGSVGVLRDISARKRRERELERYEDVIELAADGMYMLDRSGAFDEVNSRMETLTGYDESELLEFGPATCLTEETYDRFESEIGALLSAARPWGSVEGDLETADGDLVPIEARITLVYRDGEFDGTVGIVRDITERRERKRELERQNDRLEEFAGIVSHDLRNPLNVAEGRLELLDDEVDSVHLAPARRALSRMDDIIEDVLTLTRHGTTDVSPHALEFEPLVWETWRTVDGPEATLTVAGALGTIPADESRLRRILENLFRNAVEHAGPDVTVRVGRLDGESGFYVEDDGPGVPPGDRETVFRTGYTSSADGTGYGLEIVRELVAAHGWAVEVRTGNEGGARFVVTGVSEA